MSLRSPHTRGVQMVKGRESTIERRGKPRAKVDPDVVITCALLGMLGKVANEHFERVYKVNVYANAKAWVMRTWNSAMARRGRSSSATTGASARPGFKGQGNRVGRK